MFFFCCSINIKSIPNQLGSAWIIVGICKTSVLLLNCLTKFVSPLKRKLYKSTAKSSVGSMLSYFAQREPGEVFLCISINASGEYAGKMHNFRQKLYPTEMRETTSKYKLPVHFSKAKLVCYPFATIYYLNVRIFHKIHLHLLHLQSGFKNAITHKIYPKRANIYPSAVCMLVTLRMSGFGQMLQIAKYTHTGK